MIKSRLLIWTLLATLTAGSALAVPKLRLTNSAIGPISIATGANGPLQVVEAFNVGDGALNLSLTASDAWLAPAVGPARPCSTGGGTCLPINIVLPTAGLDRGVRTGTITVADPNAADAPQTITVTVMMGGGVPERADLFVAPNGSMDTLAFNTNNELQARVTTASGGPWLSLVLEGGGSFRFLYPYRIEGRHLGGLAEGAYNGSVNVTGSGFPQDVRNVPVSLRVTSEPIARLSSSAVFMKVPENTFQPASSIFVSNRGMGTLAVTGTQVATEDGGAWLTAAKVEGADVISVTADTSALTPGVFRGTVTIESNAVNGPLVVPVTLELVAQSRPLISFQGVVNNGTFEANDPIPQGGVGAVFGEQFTYQGALQGGIPLATSLGDTSVFVNGVAVPLYFVFYGQIAFQLPFETPPGEATVVVVRGGQAGNIATIQVVERNARLLVIPVGGPEDLDIGIATHTDGALVLPRQLGGRPARPGDVITIWAIGFGQSQPPVATGAPAPGQEPLARIVPAPTVFFGGGLTGGVPTPASFIGMTPNSVGLYQINVTIPFNAPRGSGIPVRVDGVGIISNRVTIAIE